MEAGQASLLAPYPGGFPGASVVGEVVNLLLFIPSKPVPTARPRARVVEPRGGKPFVQFYPDRKSQDYEAYVADWARQQVSSMPELAGVTLPLARCRLLVSLRFNLAKPKSYPPRIVHHTKKPDNDNLSKGVLDGLVKGHIIVDDAMITDLAIKKRYVEWDHPEGVEVDLTSIPTEV